MEKYQIHLSDIGRILFGVAPAEFLIEVLFRTIISYVVIVFVVKILGKRMGNRLTSTETAVMLMFGAVVSGSMQIPDRGIIESTFVLVLIVIFQRGITLWTLRSRKFEDVVLGKMFMLVKEGVMLPQGMKTLKISNQEIFGELRGKGIHQLGEVKRVYIETNGSFTLYKKDEPVPGLSVYPVDDMELSKTLSVKDGQLACSGCGTVYPATKQNDKCQNCGATDFVNAVL